VQIARSWKAGARFEAGESPGVGLVWRLLFRRPLALPDEAWKIPDGVASLVRDTIDRLETLHVLFLLQSTSPRAWTIRDVSAERRSSRYAAEVSLRTLADHGLLARQDEVYRFAPRTISLAERTAALAECYRTRPTAVISLIFSDRSDRGPLDPA
jgi:hypothetical protein